MPIKRPTINLTSGISQNGVTTSIEIEELADKPNVYEKLKDSIAPSIYGYENIKEAIALQLFSGTRKKREDGTATRGDIHIFLIGDPGAGKSEMLKFTAALAPKSRFVAGKGATGAGLTAALEAHEAGADVIILEKMPVVGGNTNYATGGLNAAETSVQAGLGIEDSVELYFNDTMKGGKE